MSDILALSEAVDRAGREFDEACKPHYCNGRWGAYQAFETGQDVPKDVEAALDAYHKAAQAFYVARDGGKGFLGGRGL